MTSILGIGLDLVDLDRLGSVLARHGDAFVNRICRTGECRRSAADRAGIAHLGGLFAAKEAAMKALGTGWANGVGFRQVEVVRRAGGAPDLELHGAARQRALTLGVGRIHVTISHDGRTAAAVVILEAGHDGAAA